MKIPCFLMIAAPMCFGLSETAQKSFDKIFSKWLTNPKTNPENEWNQWQSKYLNKIQKDSNFAQWESSRAFPAWKRLLQNYAQDSLRRNWALNALAQFSPQRVLPAYSVDSSVYQAWLWSSQDSADYRSMRLYNQKGQAVKARPWIWARGDWALGETKVLWVDPSYGPGVIFPRWQWPSCAFAGHEIEITWAEQPPREMQMDGLALSGARFLAGKGVRWKFLLDSNAGLRHLRWNGFELGSMVVHGEDLKSYPQEHRRILWAMYGLFPQSVDSLLGVCQVQSWRNRDWNKVLERPWGEKLDPKEAEILLMDFLDMSLAQKDWPGGGQTFGGLWQGQAEMMERVLRSHRKGPKHNALLLASLWRMGYWNSTMSAELLSLYELRDVLDTRALGELALVFVQLKDTRRARLLLERIAKNDKKSCQNSELWYLYQSGLTLERFGECLGVQNTQWQALVQSDKARLFFRRSLGK